jgi:mannose-6-phosphate isomerase-like protein (cupin superfamily)
MVATGAKLDLHDGETVTIRTSAADSDGELLEMEAEWKPVAAHKPPAHFHPHQDEHFEIHEGELTVQLGKETRVLRAGDGLDIPRGTVHSMWPSGGEVTRASWQLRPALRSEDFFAAVHRLRAAGKTSNKGGMIDLPAAGLIFQAFPDEFRLALPGPVRRPAIALLAAIGKVRGYPAVETAPGAEK